jgi:hypothetical protein
VRDQRVEIVREEYSLLAGGPLENGRIGCSGKPRVLDTGEVQRRKSTAQPTDDIAIEIFVRR